MRSFQHYLAALIPVKKWRRKIRGQKYKTKTEKINRNQLQNDIAFLKNQIQTLANKEIQPPKLFLLNEDDLNALKRQIQTVDSKISQLYKMMVLKEIAPDLLQHFKTDLFPIDNGVYETYSAGLIYQPEIQAIRNKFSAESENLVSALSHVENDIPYENRFQIYKELIKLNTPHKRVIYYQAIFNSLQYRNLEDTLFFCQSMEKEHDSWTLMMDKSWILYISVCLLKNDKEKAKELLTRYVKQFNHALIHNYLPVAHLAHEMGITNENINRANKVFLAFDKSEREKTFENMVQGKKVAIVGNGPQEIGSGNGKKIDTYDVVIRFNGVKIDDNFKKDYGTKTTIIARWWGATMSEIPVSLMAHAEDIYLCALGDTYIKTLEEYIQNGGIISYFNNKDLFQNDMNVSRPTTGIQYLWWVKHINPDFSMDDCYGFSFKEQEISSKPIDYYNLKIDLSTDPHNMIKEKKVILKYLEK